VVESFQSTPPLSVQGLSAWWYPQDNTRAATTFADSQTQTTVPIRTGQRQGFVIQVFNFTNRTQTVLGSDEETAPNGGTNTQIGVSTLDPVHAHGAVRSLRYTLPMSIPPDQSRYLRWLWTSRHCIRNAGSDTGTDELILRVRVGRITRTEVIQLGQGWYLGPGKGACP
jgi:hypothetical protein